MMLRTSQATLLLMVAIAAGDLIASPATAVTISFTNSNQLNLANREILSAVSFYDSTPETPGSGQQITGTIQGVTFTNFDHQTQTTAGPLTTVLPQPGGGRAQINVPSTITGTGADEIPAEQLATALTYWNFGSSGTLSYAFGATNANRPVEVQLIGGEEGWSGVMDVEVNNVVLGTMAGDTNNATADLLTFSTTTDALGNLVLDISVNSGNFYGLAAAMVTAELPPPIPAPEPTSLALLGVGTLLLVRKRRSAN